MRDQVDEIKEKVDIVSIINEYIPLQKAGRNYKALCPFHSEKTPSFLVSQELQIFRCFGCGEGGDAISFLQKYEGMDFPEALKYLADRAGVKLEPFGGDQRSEKEKLYEVNGLASRFYHYILLNHPLGKPALSYLIKTRGINMNSIKTFMLGFAPENPHALTDFIVKKKKFVIQDLERAGLAVSASGKFIDRFRGRVIFPLYDHRGNSVGLAGRILPDIEKTLPAGRQVAKYINSPETPVYHKGSLLYAINITQGDIKREGEVIVVEGELDAISSWERGVKNVVSIKGTAFTEDQSRILSRFAKTLILALDSDIAGDTAIRRSITIAESLGFEVKVVNLGKYKDPDEAVRSDPEGFKRSISHAQGVWDYLVESILSKGGSVGEVSKKIVSILAEIPDKIVQAHYIKLVSYKLGVPPEAVAEQIGISEQEKKLTKRKIEEIVEPKIKSRRELLEERLLLLYFQTDPASLSQKKYQYLIKMPLTKRILEEFKKYHKTKDTFDPSLFAKSLPSELLDGFARLLMSELGIKVDDPAKVEKEINLIEKELRELDIRDKLAYSAQLISRLEKEGKKIELQTEKKKFKKLSSKLSKS